MARLMSSWREKKEAKAVVQERWEECGVRRRMDKVVEGEKEKGGVSEKAAGWGAREERVRIPPCQHSRTWPPCVSG